MQSTHDNFPVLAVADPLRRVAVGSAYLAGVLEGGSHAVGISHPAAVAALIRKAADHTAGTRTTVSQA